MLYNKSCNMKIFVLIILTANSVCTRILNNADTKSETVRKFCLFNDTQTLSRVNTSSRLHALRKVLSLQALLITSDDEHQTEFVSDYDKRLKYISGFSGSSGSAIVTADKAALWTDSRYHLQADNELDCNWLVMKVGNNNVPSKEEWLKLQFPHGAKIGADPKLISADVWSDLETKLTKLNRNFTLLETNVNLVDAIWGGHNETDILKGFTVHERYTGKNWSEKIKWLNEYNSRIRSLVGPELKRKNDVDAFNWMLEKTKNI